MTKDVSIGNAARSQKGSSTLEILIAFSILVISLAAVITVVFGNQTVSANTQTATEALYRAKAMLETARAAARADFYGLSATSSTETVGPLTYTKSLAVADTAPFTKQATSTISWSEGGRNLSVTLGTLFTDALGDLTGDTCNPTLSGDWSTPLGQQNGNNPGYSYFDFPSAAGTTGIDIAGKRAYLTTNPSGGADDFYVVDVSNPGPPGARLTNYWSFATSFGLADVRVSGNYAFVAVDSAANQFLVIDKSDPASMKIPANGKLKVSSTGDIGNTLFFDYKTHRVYLGTTKGFYIIDVSDPKNPTKIGTGFRVGSQVNQIVVNGNIAYVASASSSPLIALDISDPNNVTKTLHFDDDSGGLLEGKSLLLSGSTLYFGRDGGGSSAYHYPQLYSLKASDFSVNWSLITATKSKNDGVNRMVLRTSLLFVAADKTNGGFEVYDVSSLSSPPSRYDTNPLNIQQSSTAGFDCEGNLLFVGERSQHALQIVGPS